HHCIFIQSNEYLSICWYSTSNDDLKIRRKYKEWLRLFCFRCTVSNVTLHFRLHGTIMGVVRLLSVLLELNLAAVASRSSLMGALIRTSNPSNLHSILDFLTGLSCGELECLAEFQGACLLEMGSAPVNPYRMLAEFFDPQVSERWRNCE